MGAKRYSTEQIIVKLRQAEIEMGRGVKVPEVCRKLGIAEQTFYRWRESTVDSIAARSVA